MRVIKLPFSKKLLLPHQYAIGVRSGAEKMGKRTSFDAAQLPGHQWLIPDVVNAYDELDREEAVNDMCEVHPLAGTNDYCSVHCSHFVSNETRDAESQKYVTVTGAIQDRNAGVHVFTISSCILN